MIKLKIKDIVNLKELEKFGFTERGIFKVYKYTSKDAGIYVHKKDRTICISNSFEGDIYDLSILYDLFKADLVEKIGDNNESN